MVKNPSQKKPKQQLNSQQQQGQSQKSKQGKNQLNDVPVASHPNQVKHKVLPNHHANYDYLYSNLMPLIFRSGLKEEYSLEDAAQLKGNAQLIVYHLWLDCLYDRDVTFAIISRELSKAFGSKTNDLIDKRQLFVVGHNEGGKLKPAGSCYVLINLLSVSTKSRSLEAQIMDAKLRMIKSSRKCLTPLVKAGSILILREAYTKEFDAIRDSSLDVYKRALMAVNGAQPVKTAVQSAQTNKQPISGAPKQATGIDKNSVNPVKPTTVKKTTSLPKITVQKGPPELIVLSDSSSTSSIISSASNDRLSAYCTNEFLPVTLETIEIVNAILNKFASENRQVAVLIDACFAEPKPKIETIRHKFGDIFGSIDDDCVFIVSQCDTSLKKNLTDAMPFSPTKQAFVVASKGRTKSDVVAAACPRDVCYGIMTVENIRLCLEKGSILMIGSAQVRNTAKKSKKLIILPSKQSNLPSRKVETELKDQDSSPRRKRIAASFDSGEGRTFKTTAPAPVKTNGLVSKNMSDSKFKDLLIQEVESSLEREGFVKDALLGLNVGNSVIIKIENLPADLSLHAFNMMMGTYSIQKHQVVAVLLSNNQRDYMNMRLILPQGSSDIDTILSKDKRKTYCNSTLLIQRVDLKDLERFLSRNYKKIHQLDDSFRFPPQGIPYSQGSQVPII